MNQPHKRASHQRRPDTYKAVAAGERATFFLQSIRPVTHALIAERVIDERTSKWHAIACTSVAQAETKRDTLERGLAWDRFEIVELVRPATTGGQLERPAVEAR